MGRGCSVDSTWRFLFVSFSLCCFYFCMYVSIKQQYLSGGMLVSLGCIISFSPPPFSVDREIFSIFQSEEESSNLIRPLKATSAITALESHRELHKELRMTHKRKRVSQEGKTELQRVLEKRKWEQRLKASRDQEEAKKKTSELHQELLKRQQRLENLEKDQKVKQEEPEFIQVKERLRKTAVPCARAKEV
ncbi:protein FAM107B isoform X2 [Oreochromis niloticus]|uniref:protein FAM107B isoform X2 n=1 Tax=Oreochromis niloticus TaxID=8128 RepID=UPI000905121E|nr:protein FAM107B isoform X2 [Oreochromis niloticus]